MQVLKRPSGDESAVLTINDGSIDHRFEVRVEGDAALVSYEESQSRRGDMVVSDPGESVFRALVRSEPMTEFLESHDCDTVRRDYPRP